MAKKYGVKVTILVQSSIDESLRKKYKELFYFRQIPDVKQHPIGFVINWIKQVIHIEDYDVVDFNVDNLTKFFPFLLLRRHSNVIVHSHASYNFFVAQSTIKSILHKLGRNIVSHSSNVRVSCSLPAAKWLFGNVPYIQVNNGIPLEKFRYSVKDRNRIRTNLKIDGNIVFGHIGRFEHQKNQGRLVDIFAEIRRKIPRAKLLFVGQGPDMASVQAKVKKLDLDDSVLFLGYRNNVAEVLSALDAMIFPSFFEGFPLTLVEAQANGVPVFFSDTITPQVKLLPISHSFSLDASDLLIANDIFNHLTELQNRETALRILQDEGYDEDEVARQYYELIAKIAILRRHS